MFELIVSQLLYFDTVGSHPKRKCFFLPQVEQRERGTAAFSDYFGGLGKALVCED